MTTKMTKELIDRIFKDPGIKYELTEFETLGKPVHKILSIYPKTVETGRDAGKTKSTSDKCRLLVYESRGQASQTRHAFRAGVVDEIPEF